MNKLNSIVWFSIAAVGMGGSAAQAFDVDEGHDARHKNQLAKGT